ncbi:RNA-binding domain-containing protein [Kocuria sp. M1R5S2]|uniref:RNA-binding domain-containing protein n=1 Tax=Kocuria rhizosphaerae TaxID=3376285 RepID=UPI003788E1DD
MDSHQVRRLAAEGENLRTEFKRRRNPGDLTEKGLVEAVACMANAQGGTVLVGVEDNGDITGCAPWHRDRTDPAQLQALIQNHTRPALPTAVTVVDVEGVDVLVVEVPAAQVPTATLRGLYQRRALKVDDTPQCLPYEPHELFMHHFSATGRDWAELPALGASMGDLDPIEFERFRSMCRSAAGDSTLADLQDEEILRSLGMVDAIDRTTPTLGAVLLFGTPAALSRWVPHHEVLFQVLDRTRVVTNDVLRAPLLKVAQQVQERLDARNVEDELAWGLLRISLPRIPPRMAREAVANALVHRDYTEVGPVAVQLTEDAFTVRSPGGLPRGVTLANLMSESRPRSRALADAFKRAGVVERSGRGVAIMFRELLRLGRDEPDFSATTDTAVVVSVPMSSADTELAAFVHARQAAGDELSVTELRVLHLLRLEGPSTTADIAGELGSARAQLRADLHRMAEQGLVEVRGTGRGRSFHLPPGFYETVGRKADYVRAQPVSEYRREEMVLRYVREFGSITRGQVAELCGIGPRQATAVLQAMVKDGRLTMHGERRGAHYREPEPR